MFSRALAVPASAVALAATVSLFAPAAQASSPPGAQRTGTQLASALLPVSYFPPGYQKGPSHNSGRRLEHSPARYNLNTMSCKKLVASPPVTGYGETAAAVAFVVRPPSATTGDRVLPRPTLRRCTSSPAPPPRRRSSRRAMRRTCGAGRGSATLLNITFTWTTQSVMKGYFGGHRAFYAHLTTKISGLSVSHGDQQIVLVSTDVVTVAASGPKVPAHPAPAAVLAALIARIRS